MMQYPEELIKSQHPDYGVLLCSDSRVSETFLTDFSFTPGKVFVVRNIGNNYLACRGSVLYAIKELEVKEFIVLGHNNCGAIKALYSFKSLPEEIKGELFSLYLLLKDCIKKKSPDELSVENVIRQVELIERDVNGTSSTRISGMYYDFSDGDVKVRRLV